MDWKSGIYGISGTAVKVAKRWNFKLQKVTGGERMENVVKEYGDIKRAMLAHEIKAYYQPQCETSGGKVKSAEALARWVRSDGTVVPPGCFIPKLEETGEVTALDWYMLEEVLKFLKSLPPEKRLTIAVNFSRWHSEEDDFVRKLVKITDSYGIDHKYIEVEITESAVVEGTFDILSRIKDIRKNGFSVAIDDFGTGLSSLQFVKDMPIDVLKIDKSLLDHNCEDEKERIVLESIFYFARRLRFITVTEGVETKEQLSFVTACGTSKVQGFIFSKPLPEEIFRKIIEAPSEKSCHDGLSSKEPDPDGGKSREASDQQPDSETVTSKKLSSKLNSKLNSNLNSGTLVPDRMSAFAFMVNSGQLLLDAIFVKYPLVIYINLTKNAFYMMAYENFTAKRCMSVGVFDELIESGAASMHPEDRETFRNTFCREHLLKCHAAGDKKVTLKCRQMGDDGIYRRVETTDIFVNDPASDDILVISLNDNIDE